MGIRELVNKNQAAASVVVGVLIVACLVWIVRQPGTGGERGIANRQFYSDDDGKSFFVDEAAKVVPFTRDGKEAVRAHVFQCGGEKSVHYLERYTEAGKSAVEEALKASGGTLASMPEGLAATGYEFKRPGETEWQSQPPGPKRCSDGSQAELVTP